MAKGNGGGTPFMNNGVGLCSTKSNPMVQPLRTKAECGPGMNADQKKANKNLQEAQRKVDSLRGKSGM